MAKKDWWTAENLAVQEKNIKKIHEIESLDGPNGGDFGSYRKVLKGVEINSTQLGMHNDLNSKNKISFIHKLLSINKTLVSDVLDVGCGMGFTTHELGKFYMNASAVGVDISSDAISYAKEKFKSESFICEPVIPTNPNVGLFDLIFCFEFYPFTRTSSEQVHNDYLTYFLSQLKLDGKLVLHQKWNQKDSVNSKNIDQIKRNFSQFHFEIKNVPHAMMINILKFKYPSLWADWCLRKILKKDFMKVIIISKK